MSQETCKYVEFIWRTANKCEEVFIAVDGVVPMAKMKQQRLRRFKAIVLANYEIQMGVRSIDEPRWDSNAITPGTLFMKKLNSALETLCKSHSHWYLSGYSAYGEGEHKIMNHIRNLDSKDNTIIVYGLDADLILLSMINSDSHRFYLMREEMEFNRVVKDMFDEPQMLYFDIEGFKHIMMPNFSRQNMLDYIVMMSFLGNDFIPHSIPFTIKENGHTLLYQNLKQFKNHLVDTNNKIIWKNIKEFLKMCVEVEEFKFEEFCKKKSQVKAYRYNKATATDYEIKMAPIQIKPCEWFVEKELYSESLMKSDWKEIYYKKFLNEEKTVIVEEYLKGIQWVLDYYIGNPIEYDWYYPHMYPPLWEDVVKHLETNKPNIVYKFEDPLTPEQQLALVLPIQSYNLITNSKYKLFPQKYPQFYPRSFGFHSLGKKWFYECESNIPIFTSKLMRSLA